MLKKFVTTMLSLFILSQSFITLAESQSFTVVDAKCRADYIANCSADLRKKLTIRTRGASDFIKEYGEKFVCLSGYSLITYDFMGNTGQYCDVVDTIAANQSDINVCETREYRDLPQNCYRNIDAVKLDQIHTSLTGDMRVLLAQFCKTYAKDEAKCEEVLNPGGKK